MAQGCKLLQNARNIVLTQVRTRVNVITDPPLPEEGGIKYHGFTYYPRYKDFKDPPYEPTRLFLITRLSKMKGLNPVEREVMEELNIDGKVWLKQHVAIVKNTPQICARLWKVKHLVKIVPIKFINGLPKDGDFKGTYLRDNGEFMVSKKLEIDPEKVQSCENYINDKRRFDSATMRNYLRLRWENGYTGDM